MSDVARDFEDARSYAVELKRRVREELGLVVSVGVAPCKIVAKVASDAEKPDGLVLVRPGEEAGFLAPLDVRKLPGVGKKTAESLTEIGVQTLGQLAAMPQTVLHARFGRYGEMLLRHAQGIDNEPVEPRGEPRTMSRETTFQVDTRDLTVLNSTLRGMCEELAQDLRGHGKRTRTITLKLRYEDFHTVTRQSSLATEVSEAGALFDIAVRLLHELAAGERQRVRLIGVRASNLSGPERQLGLFDQEAARMQNVERAIAQVRGRFGPDSIQTLREKRRKPPNVPRTT